MLRDIIPAEWRKPVYAVYAVIGVVLGAIQLALVPNPAWLLTSMTVYLFLGGAIGAVASSNTPAVDKTTVTTVTEDADPEEPTV
jgi:hypothetical protein